MDLSTSALADGVVASVNGMFLLLRRSLVAHVVFFCIFVVNLLYW